MWCGARGVPLGGAAGSYVGGYTHRCGQASRSLGGGSWTVHLAAFDKCVCLLPPSCRALHSVSGPSLAPPCAAGPYMIARGFLGLPAGAVAHACRILDCNPKATPLGVFGHLGEEAFRVPLGAVSFRPQLCRLLLRIPFCLRACAMVIRLTAQYVTKSKQAHFLRAGHGGHSGARQTTRCQRTGQLAPGAARSQHP